MSLPDAEDVAYTAPVNITLREYVMVMLISLLVGYCSFWLTSSLLASATVGVILYGILIYIVTAERNCLKCVLCTGCGAVIYFVFGTGAPVPARFGDAGQVLVWAFLVLCFIQASASRLRQALLR